MTVNSHDSLCTGSRSFALIKHTFAETSIHMHIHNKNASPNRQSPHYEERQSKNILIRMFFDLGNVFFPLTETMTIIKYSQNSRTQINF